MSDDTLLPADLQNRLATAYINKILATVRNLQIPLDAVILSPTELTLALRECQKDMDILRFRRTGNIGVGYEDFDGISIGKLAGSLAFRLSRYHIVHVAEQAVSGFPENVRRRCAKLQELAALFFIWDNILKIRPPKTQPELLYLLSRRHMNQEMIGLTFDVYSERGERLKTRTPLDQPPFNRLFKHA
ncbi:MAG TPA: hypothetical protein PKZ97_03315 [Azospirillaceae bacterium]|nr:hypothetical protein [Azospirillaceae bacterium]HRQ80123.1 hypothetical protein [Azospirillaceae bacterium]